MPAPLLGPNLGGTHLQPVTQSFISGDTNAITPGSPLVYDYSTGVPAIIRAVLASTASANQFLGIALRSATKGNYVSAATDGIVRAKVSGSPAVNAKLQIAAGGTSLTTQSTGAIVGYALESQDANGYATVLLRAS